MIETGLVLQGGGALGAYEFGAVKYLYETLKVQPCAVSGVSIGAINAAVLVGARKDPIRTLEEMWRRLSIYFPIRLPDHVDHYLSLWGNPNFYRMRTDIFSASLWTNFYDIEPMKETLEDLIDFDELNESPIHLMLGAMNVKTGEFTLFQNHEACGQPRTILTVDHILAAGSIPPGFPMTQIEEKYYWDGGLFNNTPLAPVMTYLKSRHTPAAKRVIVVELFARQGKVPQNMLQVKDRMLELQFASKLADDLNQAERVNAFVKQAGCKAGKTIVATAERQMGGKTAAKDYEYMEIVKIGYRDGGKDEEWFACSDFASERIRARIAHGERDAAQSLKALGLAPPSPAGKVSSPA